MVFRRDLRPASAATGSTCTSRRARDFGLNAAWLDMTLDRPTHDAQPVPRTGALVGGGAFPDPPESDEEGADREKDEKKKKDEKKEESTGGVGGGRDRRKKGGGGARNRRHGGERAESESSRIRARPSRALDQRLPRRSRSPRLITGALSAATPR
jgi:hypothetical protein